GPSFLGSECEVAGEHELEPTRDRPPMHGSDRDSPRRGDALEDLRDASRKLGPGGLAVEQRDVCARAERVTATTDDDDSGGGSLLGLRECLVERAQERKIVGVLYLRSV